MSQHSEYAEQYVRGFAVEFPTPNVLKALALCEAGHLAWEQVAVLLVDAMQKALFAVRNDASGSV